MFTARRRSQLTAGTAVLVAVLLLAACDWTQFRYGPDHTGFNPTETRISPANVSGLRLRWSQSVGTPGIQHPMTIANGVVYAVSWQGRRVDANTEVHAGHQRQYPGFGALHLGSTVRCTSPRTTLVSTRAALQRSRAMLRHRRRGRLQLDAL